MQMGFFHNHLWDFWEELQIVERTELFSQLNYLSLDHVEGGFPDDGSNEELWAKYDRT